MVSKFADEFSRQSQYLAQMLLISSFLSYLLLLIITNIDIGLQMMCIWKLRWKVWRLTGRFACNGGILGNFSIFPFIFQLSRGTRTIGPLPGLPAPLFWTEGRFCTLRGLRSPTPAFISAWLSMPRAQPSCFTVFRFTVSILKLTKNAYMHQLSSF